MVNFEDALEHEGSMSDSEQQAQEIQQLREQVENLSQQLTTMQYVAQQQAAQANQPAYTVTSNTGTTDKLKVEKPHQFTGKIDKAEVDTFIYQCELYYGVMQIGDDQQRVAFATLLLAGDAAIWLQSKYTLRQLSQITWNQFVRDLETQFRPVDHARRARDSLASCTQTGSVAGYVSAFWRILVHCTDVSDAEALDRFTRGLKPDVRRWVLIRQCSTFEDAAVVAERIAAAGTSTTNHGQRVPQPNPPPPPRPAGNGPTPMDLGVIQGDHSTLKCYACGKVGHIARNCRTRKNERRGRGTQ